MPKITLLCLLAVLSSPAAFTQSTQVKTVNGILAGVDESGVRAFRGIPFAAPPVGELRWRAPQIRTKLLGHSRRQSRVPSAAYLLNTGSPAGNMPAMPFWPGRK